ncbi:MAG: hypothetical protein MJ252_17480 [archaeon]|nr:hypothetical protein [archaeon]
MNIKGQKQIDEYYVNLQRIFKNYKNIKSEYIQEIVDFSKDERGLFFILEFCEFTLSEYTRMVREPLKGSRYPIELKFRYIISDLIKGIIEIHKMGLYLCSLLNGDDIQIKEELGKTASNKFKVKLPHPFLSHVMTLINLVPFHTKAGEEEDEIDVNNFRSYFPPEVYINLKKAMKKEIELRHFNEYFINWELLSPFLNQKFDKWSLGYLLYEIIFNAKPFAYENFLMAADKCSHPDQLKYTVFPKRISYICLQLIEECLKYDSGDRIQDIRLQNISADIAKENSNMVDLEIELKSRMDSTRKGIDTVDFEVNSKQSQLESNDLTLK